MKPNLFGMRRDALEEAVAGLGERDVVAAPAAR